MSRRTYVARPWSPRWLAVRLVLLIGATLLIGTLSPAAAVAFPTADPRQGAAAAPRRMGSAAVSNRPRVPGAIGGSVAQRIRRGIPGAIGPQQTGSTLSGAVELPNHTPVSEPQGVWLIDAADGSYVSFTNTSTGGTFTLSNIAAGSYTLLVIPGDNTAAGAITNLSVPVPDANPISLGTLTLPSAPNTLSGTVTLPNGTPIANATVVAYDRNTWQYTRRSVTSASGAYSMNVSGNRWVVYLESNPSASWYYGGSTFEATFFSTTVTHDFVAQSIDGHITGQIVDANGNPMTFPTNTASLGMWNSNENSIAVTLATNGHFDVAAAAGLYTFSLWLSATEPSYQNVLAPPSRQVELVAGTVNLGQLRLRLANSTITGTLADAQGPIGQMDVAAWNTNGDYVYTTTTSGGAYQLKVTPGTWSVQPSLSEAQQSIYLYASSLTQQKDVADGQTANADFTLERAADTINGTLVDASTGSVLGDANGWAYLSRPGDTATLNVASIAAGAFQMPAPTGDVVINVALSSDSQYSADTPVTVPAAGPRTARVELQRNGASITGTLRDGSGMPVLGVDGVVIAEEAGTKSLFRYAWINPLNGGYTLKVPTGNWLVSYYLYSDQYRSDPNNVQLVQAADGAIKTADLSLVTLDGQVRAIVRDSNGTPVPNTLVWATFNNQEVYAITDENGAATLYVPYTDPSSQSLGGAQVISPQGRQQPPVQMGTASRQSDTQRSSKPLNSQCKALPAECARQRAAMPRSQPVAPRPGGKLQVAAVDDPIFLDLRTANSTLDGIVVGPSGAAQPNAYISASSDDAQWVSGVTDNQGKFSLPVIRNSAGGTVWDIRVRYIDGTIHTLLATSKSLSAAPAADAKAPIDAGTLALASVAGVSLPTSQSYAFSDSQGLALTLKDQTEISIPQNAFLEEKNTKEELKIRAAINAQVQYPDTELDRLAGYYGYEIQLFNQQTGELLNQPLAQNAVITFHYSDSDLQKLGVAELNLRPAWYDTEQATWRIADGYLIDTAANTVSVQTKHLNNWALVQSQSETHLFLPLVQR